MDIKDRTIRIKGDSMMIDEIGIEDKEIYYRNIAVSRDVYEQFKQNPDEEMLFDQFLKDYDIHSDWKRYEINIPGSVHADEKKKLYDEWSEKESLINNPYIMDIFNEAMRENSELTAWESVFPFFR